MLGNFVSGAFAPEASEALAETFDRGCLGRFLSVAFRTALTLCLGKSKTWPSHQLTGDRARLVIITRERRLQSPFEMIRSQPTQSVCAECVYCVRFMRTMGSMR